MDNYNIMLTGGGITPPSLSLCLSVLLSVCLSTCLSTCLSFSLSLSLSLSVPLFLSPLYLSPSQQKYKKDFLKISAFFILQALFYRSFAPTLCERFL